MTDYTLRAVQRQIKFLKCDHYELGIFNRSSGTMKPRVFNKTKLLKAVGFLKHQNYQGNDIYIRPKGESPYVFLDDISLGSIKKMETDGLKLSVVIESSPMNYHGWLNVNGKVLNAELASMIGRYLARTYDGDIHCTDWRHFGRLAGFTNRKSEHVNDLGQFPFVNIYDGYTGIAADPDSVIDKAIELVKMEANERYKLIISRPMQVLTDEDPRTIYRAEIHSAKDFWSDRYNSSDADWRAVCRLLSLGFSNDTIHSILLDLSESVHKRNPQRGNEYATRTINNALRFFNKPYSHAPD